MKCKSCKKTLKYFYYDIGGLEYCKACALEFMADVKDFKVNLRGSKK